jgi:hypothetical protein
VAGSTEKFTEKLVLEVGKSVPPEHDALLQHVKKLFDISRKTMATYYETWDYHDEIFRSRRQPDKEDRTAATRGQPKKMIVPLTYSQIMTFVSFCVMTVTQNKRFFELEYQGNKPPMLKEPVELILEHDCRRNQWNAFLVQFFLDVARFWMGAAEICYKEEVRYMRIPQTTSVEGAFGVPTESQSNNFVPIPSFVGNRVYPISPYRMYPDTRLPLTRFQEGEFCGSEDMFTMSSLHSDSGDLFNLDMIPKMHEADFKERRKLSRIDEIELLPTRKQGSVETITNVDENNMVRSGSVVISKMCLDIIPKNFKVQDEQVLGKEDFPVRYLCWIANDHTVIRFEECYYLHGQFPYIIAQFLPDQHETINEGLSSVCDQITSLITWKLNAHLTSQKNSVESKWIIDPAGIDVKSLESRNPYIMLKKNASQTGVDRYIKQFDTKDVTAGVMQDVSVLKELLESVTGVSAQMQGQYSQGRRSATQDRVVAQGASARAKSTLSSIWDTSFEPLGRQFIANNRQEMSMEDFQSILGDGPFGPSGELTLDQLYAMFKADPVTIAKSEEFFIFDGTLPSEKAFLAQSLQEIFIQITQNPIIMQVLGYGPEQMRYIFDEIYELRGLTPPMIPPASLPPQPAAAPIALPPPAPGQLAPGQPFGPRAALAPANLALGANAP